MRCACVEGEGRHKGHVGLLSKRDSLVDKGLPPAATVEATKLAHLQATPAANGGERGGLKDGAMEGGDQQGFLAVVDLTQRKIAIEDVSYQNSIYSSMKLTTEFVAIMV